MAETFQAFTSYGQDQERENQQNQQTQSQDQEQIQPLGQELMGKVQNQSATSVFNPQNPMNQRANSQMLKQLNTPSQREIDLEEQGSFDAMADNATYDNQGLADGLNAQINEVAGESNLTKEAEAIKNAYDIPITQYDKYEKNYYKPVRNTGIAALDNAKEIGWMEAYLAKKIGIDVKYTFLRHEIKGDFSHKVKSQSDAIKKLQETAKTLEQVGRNAREILGSDLVKNNILTGVKNFAHNLSGGTINTGTNEYMERNRQQGVLMAQLLSKDGDRTTAKERENYIKEFSKHGDLDTKLQQTKILYETGANKLKYEIERVMMSDVSPNKLLGMQYMYRAAKAIQDMSVEEMKADPKKLFALTYQYEGYSPAEIRELLVKKHGFKL